MGPPYPHIVYILGKRPLRTAILTARFCRRISGSLLDVCSKMRVYGFRAYRMWLWVYYNEIPLYPIFYLLQGDYMVPRSRLLKRGVLVMGLHDGLCDSGFLD